MDYAGCTHKLKASILMENLSSSQRKAPPLETERGFLAAAASFAMWRLGSVGADSSVSAVPWCVGANLQTSGLPCTPSTPRPHEPTLADGNSRTKRPPRSYAGPRQSRDSSPICPMAPRRAGRHATALVQVGSQIQRQACSGMGADRDFAGALGAVYDRSHGRVRPARLRRPSPA